MQYQNPADRKPPSPDKFPEEAHAPKDWSNNNVGGVLIQSVAPAGSGSVQEEINRIVDYMSKPTIKCHKEM